MSSSISPALGPRSISGTLRLSDSVEKRTFGGFSILVNENRQAFRRYFGVELFPGSLNVDIANPGTLQADLDAGRPPPAFVIPREELINMPAYIGSGQAWSIRLSGPKFADPEMCWIFRRIGSRVPYGVIEVVATIKLRDKHNLSHGDEVSIEFVDSTNEPRLIEKVAL